LSPLDPHTPGNFRDPPWGGYGYLLESHIGGREGRHRITTVRFLIKKAEGINKDLERKLGLTMVLGWPPDRVQYWADLEERNCVSVRINALIADNVSNY